MSDRRLVVIEGLDGSGKATQTALLVRRLTEGGRACRQVSFPDYKHPSSVLVKLYLEGRVGALEEVNAFAASSFFSVDRYVSYQTQWKTDYLAGLEIVADRYTTSNIAHQMVKLPRDAWVDFIRWLTDFEYGRLGLPQPDLVIYLDMHPETSRRLLETRSRPEGPAVDIHEADLAYLMRCREAAL
jgi:dTMP kinase